MSDVWKILVEGKPDRKFVSTLVATLGLAEVEVEMIGGGVEHLKCGAVQNLIRRNRDVGARIATVFDANGDIEKKRRLCEEIKEEFGLDIERSFWLPNDADAGSLETLLERIAVPEHQEIFDCLDGYVDCLERLDPGYDGPCEKGRIFAYCEAVGAETDGVARDYERREHWDLEAETLEPLRAFVRGLE